MIAIDTLLREPVVQAVGWALLHFVWQGALIGAAAAIALRLLRHSAADVRYVVGAVALALMATMPVVTAVQSMQGGTIAQSSGSLETVAETGSGRLPATTGAQLVESCGESASCGTDAVLGFQVEPILPVVVLAWMAGVALLAVRLAGGWLAVQQMKRNGSSPAAASLQAIVARLSRTLHISRTVTLLQSTAVDVPTVIGWLKPTVLIPIGTLGGLSPLQIEAILAHELAHIRRHDYLVNLLQTLVETLLFYHPAVWWLSRRIRIEREHCCDDLAVSLCGDPVVYARALADLEELRAVTAPLAMAATGGSLVERVRRLLSAPASHAGRGPAWLAAATAVFLVGVIIAGPAGRQPLDAAEAPALEPITASAMDLNEGQAPPAPPAPSTPPTPPTPPASSAMSHQSSSKDSGTIRWSSDGVKVVVTYDGAFTINDHDTDIATLSPNGYVKVSDGAWLRGRSVEFTADGAGVITRRFLVGSTERPFEPEGREWLEQIFPRFVRQSGLNAKERVARLLGRGGIEAVLTDIAAIEGSYAKRLYFSHLLKQAPLNADAARRVLEQAGREIDSDYELASLLIDVASKVALDDAGRTAYFAAARRIGSDYEMRRVYSNVLKRGTLSAPLLVSLLEGSRDLGSDYEAASLLIEVIDRHPIDGAARQPFFDALAGISSAYEKGRVLQRLLRRSDVSDEALVAAIRESATIDSDYEASRVLVAAARSRSLAGPARDAYISAAERLGEHEKNQALAALVRTSR